MAYALGADSAFVAAPTPSSMEALNTGDKGDTGPPGPPDEGYDVLGGGFQVGWSYGGELDRYSARESPGRRTSLAGVGRGEECRGSTDADCNCVDDAWQLTVWAICGTKFSAGQE